MELKVNRRSVLLRWLRVLVVTVVGLVAGWVASPDMLALVGAEYSVVVTAVLVPSLAALDKYLRAKWGVKKALAAARAAEAEKKAKAAARRAAKKKAS